MHLRRCAQCGHIGCCDSSKNKHATKHFRQTKHPIMQSFEPGEDWRWCYVDEVAMELVVALGDVQERPVEVEVGR